MTYEKRKDFFLFFVGLIGSFQIRIVGTFYVAEIVALVSCIFISVSEFKNNRKLSKMYHLLLLWLAGALFSDFWNHSTYEDTMKGAFNILLMIGQIPFVYWALKDKTERWIYYAAGAAISYVANFYLFRESMFESLFDREIWELYSWSPLFIITSCVLYYRNHKKIGLLVLAGWSFYTLFNNSRNVFLTQTMAIVLVYLIDKVKSGSLYDQVINYRGRIVRLLLGLIVSLFIVDNVYETLASQGALGERAYEKYVMQKFATGGLASGRSDSIISVDFILHNPIIGYGSYAVDKTGASNVYRRKHNIELSDRVGMSADYATNAIPCHSILLGTWVWHGIFAGIWWMFFFFLIWRVFKSGALLVDKRMLLMSVSFIMSMLFDLFFSPMGARMPYVYLAVYLILVYDDFEYKLNNSIVYE